MKSFIPAITLVALIGLQNPMEAAWSAKGPHAKSQPVLPNTPGLKVADDRYAFIEADYLYWRPQMEDLGYVTKSTTATDGSIQTVLKQPTFKLSSGARVGVGMYNSDSWDIGLKATYLYSQVRNTATAHTDETLSAQWIQNLMNPTTIASAKNFWKMHFYLLDLAFGREFFLTKHFSVHPFIGLRGAHMSQTNTTRYNTSYDVGDTSAPTSTDVQNRIRANNRLWAVGPRVGLDLNYYICNTWSFLGGLSGSVLYTNYHAKQSLAGGQAVTANTTITLSNLDLTYKNENNLARANIEGYFGLGWDKWYNQGRNRLAISFIFEGSQWFGLNQWSNIGGTTGSAASTVQADKRSGDLSFIGGTFHFQVDF